MPTCIPPPERLVVRHTRPRFFRALFIGDRRRIAEQARSAQGRTGNEPSAESGWSAWRTHNCRFWDPVVFPCAATGMNNKHTLLWPVLAFSTFCLIGLGAREAIGTVYGAAEAVQERLGK